MIELGQKIVFEDCYNKLSIELEHMCLRIDYDVFVLSCTVLHCDKLELVC